MSSPLCPKATDLQSAAFADLLLARISKVLLDNRLAIGFNSSSSSRGERFGYPLAERKPLSLYGHNHYTPFYIICQAPFINFSIVNHIYLFAPHAYICNAHNYSSSPYFPSSAEYSSNFRKDSHNLPVYHT